jgi:hypothetical protein
MVGLLEIFIGLSLLLGLWVRPAAVRGASFMLNLTLSAWWQPALAHPCGAASEPSSILSPCRCFLSFSSPLMPARSGDAMAGGERESKLNPKRGIMGIEFLQ